MDTGKTLDELITDLLIDEGKNNESEYLRYYNIGLRGLKELNTDVNRDLKTVTLTMDSNQVINFPSDYVGYTKIGLVDDNGRIHVLGLDNRRIKQTGFTATASAASDQSDSYYLFRNFLNDGSLGSLYGVGGGNNANVYYVEDRANNRFLFSTDVATDTIVVEYITDGSSDISPEKIMIDPYSEEALMSFIFWKSIQRKRGIPQYEKDSARRDYYNEKRLALARMSKFTKEEALQTTRKAFKQSPKL